MIEQLLDRAFGEDRHARTAYRVRIGAEWLPALSFAVIDSDELLVGTIQSWPVALATPEGQSHPMIMVGPVAVVPERQSEGFGKVLMLGLLRALGNDALPQIMIGDPDYYGRFFGFSATPTGGWHLPGPCDPARLLVRTSNTAVLPRKGMLGAWEAAEDLAD